jgi:hypothetical protein
MPEIGASRIGSRLLRGAVRRLAILLALVVAGAAAYEHVGAWRDSRVLEQVGRSVDLGGRTLNIHCTGDGSPTVVFVGGRTSPGTSGRQPSAASPRSPAPAGTTAPTSGGAIPGRTRPGATRQHGICISSC